MGEKMSRKGVEAAWAAGTPLLKDFMGTQGTSVLVTAIVTTLAEPMIAAYLEAETQERLERLKTPEFGEFMARRMSGD